MTFPSVCFTPRDFALVALSDRLMFAKRQNSH